MTIPDTSILPLKRSFLEISEVRDFDAEYTVNQTELDQADGPDEVCLKALIFLVKYKPC